MIDISPIQVVMVLVIALLAFGPRRLPELGRTIGRQVREVRSALNPLEEATGARPRWAATRPTVSVCMTWSATSSSGHRTAIIRTIPAHQRTAARGSMKSLACSAS